MIKESIHQGDITIINIYAPNTRVPIYISTHRSEGSNRNNIITVGAHIPLSTMARLSREPISKETLDLNYTSEQQRNAHLLKHTQNVLQGRSYVRSQNKSQYVLKDWNCNKYLPWPQDVDLHSNNKRKTRKFINMWKWNNNEIKREIKKYTGAKMETQHIKMYGIQQKQC